MIEMPAVEREIVEKFNRLDANAQTRVLSRLQGSNNLSQPAFDSTFDYEGWFREIEQLQEQLRVENGGEYPKINVVQLVRELRDGEDE